MPSSLRYDTRTSRRLRYLVGGLLLFAVMLPASRALAHSRPSEEERSVDPRSPEVRAAVRHIMDVRRRALSRAGGASTPSLGAQLARLRSALWDLRGAAIDDASKQDDVLSTLGQLRSDLRSRIRPPGHPAAGSKLAGRERSLDEALRRLERRVVAILAARPRDRPRLASELLGELETSPAHARGSSGSWSSPPPPEDPSPRRGKTVYTPEELEAAIRAQREAGGR